MAIAGARLRRALDSHVWTIPVLQQDDGSYCALMTGTPIEIKRSLQ
jgi:hypothetical protein